MVSVEDSEDNLVRKHDELVNKLNLDEETAEKAWNSFETIMQNYTLEVCLHLHMLSSLHMLRIFIFTKKIFNSKLIVIAK